MLITLNFNFKERFESNHLRRLICTCFSWIKQMNAVCHHIQVKRSEHAPSLFLFPLPLPAPVTHLLLVHLISSCSSTPVLNLA